MRTFSSFVAVLMIAFLVGCATKPPHDSWTPPKLTAGEERTIRALVREEGIGDVVEIEALKSHVRSGFEIRVAEKEERDGARIAQRLFYLGWTKGAGPEVHPKEGCRVKRAFWAERIFWQRTAVFVVSGFEIQVRLGEDVTFEEAETVVGSYLEHLGAILELVQQAVPDRNPVAVFLITRQRDRPDYVLWLRRKDGKEDLTGIAVRWNGDQLEISPGMIIGYEH